MHDFPIRLDAFGEEAGPAAAAAGSEAEPAQEPAEHRPTFDELIKGEYKQDFGDRVQRILDRRLKSCNAELSAARPVMALLRQRYEIADGEGAAEAVRKALESDEAYWSSAAAAAGMKPAQYRRLLQAEADSQELRTLREAQQTKQLQNELYHRLNAEASQVRAQYPDFDLRAELQQNPHFGKLIERQVDMLTAYRLCHQDELLSQAAQQAERQALDKVRANRRRPAENGSGGTQPVKLGSDPSKWSRAQLREVERRVARGERIVL